MKPVEMKNRAALLLNATALCLAFLAMPTLAQQADVSQDPCKDLDRSAREAMQAKQEAIRQSEIEHNKRVQEASSCMQRAQDAIARAAIPPDLGSLLGVLADPVGMVKTATENAACNVVTNQANEVIRPVSSMQGAVRGASTQVQGAVVGKVNQTLGGQAGTAYPLPNNQQQADKSWYQSFACRVFGKC